MNKFSSLLAFLLLINGGLWARPADTVQLLGQWASVLPVPSGSRQVRIHISQQADGTPMAVLCIDAHHLDNSPMRMHSNADSITFVAD